MAKRLTQEQLGARLGISQSAVARLAKRGMPTDSLAAARRWRAAHLDPLRGGKGGGPAASRGKGAPAGDLNTWKTRKVKAEAQLLERRRGRRATGADRSRRDRAGAAPAVRRVAGARRLAAPAAPRRTRPTRYARRAIRGMPSSTPTCTECCGTIWADGWVLVADAFASEAPELADVFLRMAAAHNGPGSRAGALLRGRCRSFADRRGDVARRGAPRRPRPRATVGRVAMLACGRARRRARAPALGA